MRYFILPKKMTKSVIAANKERQVDIEAADTKIQATRKGDFFSLFRRVYALTRTPKGLPPGSTGFVEPNGPSLIPESGRALVR